VQFVSFYVSDIPRLGVMTDDGIIDLAAAQPQIPSDLVAALASGADLLAAANAAIASNAARLPLAGIRYAPVVPRPGKIICLGLNYFDHAKEGGRDRVEAAA